MINHLGLALMDEGVKDVLAVHPKRASEVRDLHIKHRIVSEVAIWTLQGVQGVHIC